jgi:PleD family two-component response regulator
VRIVNALVAAASTPAETKHQAQRSAGISQPNQPSFSHGVNLKTARAPGILVIDDETDIRTIVGDILVEEGYLAVLGTNGANAPTVVDPARVSLALTCACRFSMAGGLHTRFASAEVDCQYRR